MSKELTSAEEPHQEFTEEEKSKLDKIRNGIDLADSNAIIQYGVGIQSKVAGLADSVLSEVKTKDTAHVGEILTELIVKIKEFQVDGLAGSGGLLSKIPFVGALVDNAKRYLAGYQSLSVQIIRIVEALEQAKAQLLRDVTLLDRLYDRNVETYRELELYIAAGTMKFTELRETLLPDLEAQAQKSRDPIESQRYRDGVQFATRLERRLHDLRLSRTLSLQTSPQIRLVQHGNQELAERIQSSILNTIPLWKNQMVLAITLLKQKQALSLQKNVSDATKELLERNAEMLKESAIGIARESERGVVDIETLKKVNADLISTIDETIKIQHEGRIRRQQAAEEMVKIERDLKEHLMRIREMRE